mmetsp:Transcript_18079/g.30957  ORF Transcript_18079/g.30957 Transcript_18079/m.30957 type:complete len:94 (-) Transcript_18079:31-312(-)
MHAPEPNCHQKHKESRGDEKSVAYTSSGGSSLAAESDGRSSMLKVVCLHAWSPISSSAPQPSLYADTFLAADVLAGLICRSQAVLKGSHNSSA